ncbi:MAG TPA: serine hydrolase [Candidatus Binataceae bacterium]|nr:serine hydrolase [Candidatus Binataceae bacterium]
MTARSVGIAAALICALVVTSVRAQDLSSSTADNAPIGTRENYFRAPYRTGSFRHMDRIFPYHVVYRAGPVAEIPRSDRRLGEVTYQWKGAPHSLDDLLQVTKTTGFLVIKDGRIVDERYFLGADQYSTFTSMSVAKSFTSTLVGLALADGKIRSLDDPISDYIPDLKRTGYDDVPIKAILQMSSGVSFTERYQPRRYSDMDLMFERGMIDESTPLDDYLKGLSRVLPPGAKFAYKGSDTQALGWLVRTLTGESLADYLSDKIWQPLGMERDAFWNIDMPGPRGMESAFTCLNATLRDFGRFGLLFLDHGKWKGKQIVPSEWVEQATTPQSAQVESGMLGKISPLGYGYQWWTFPDDDVFAAEGIYFQFIYVNPKEHLVIVKTSAFDHPWDSLLEGQTYAAFRAIAGSLRQSSQP